MRKIVNGKIYDTHTATLIGEADYNGADTRDFHSWIARLYITPRSRVYFLHGEGGPMTRWAQSAGQNSWTGGEDIVPLSRGDAFEWAQDHLDADVVMAHFGDLVEEA